MPQSGCLRTCGGGRIDRERDETNERNGTIGHFYMKEVNEWGRGRT